MRMRLIEMGSAPWLELGQWAKLGGNSPLEEIASNRSIAYRPIERKVVFRLVQQLLSNLAGKQIVHGTAIMQRPECIAQLLDSVGVVHRVDTVNRELAVFVNGELLTFDLPIGCQVILHGEPVKLRMVQPRDRVKITHASRGSLRVAITIEVQPDEIAGRATRGLPKGDQPAR